MHAYSIFFPAATAAAVMVLLVTVAAVVVMVLVLLLVVGWCWLLLYIIYCYCWLVGWWLDPFYFNGVKYMLHGVLKKIDMLIMY